MLRTRRRTRRNLKSISRKSKFVNAFDVIDGVEKLVLVPLTQKFVGCDIGNKITAVDPWIFVHKENIDTHLEFYQSESCFYEIKDEIAAFPNEEILVGSYCCSPDIPANFFVCTTVQAQEKVLKLLAKQRNLNTRRANKMRAMTVNLLWYSFGSEEEILGEMNLNNRPLKTLEVNAILLMAHKTKFKMSFVEDRRNGYVDMLPGRNKYELVFRKLLHVGVQCTSSALNKEVQTESVGVYTKSIQYCYEYPEIKLTDTLATNINKFLLTRYPTLINNLDANIFMQLESVNYETLIRYSNLLRLHQPIDFKTYSDVAYSNCKKISCLSWNSLVSGRIAAAYATNPLFYILKEKPTSKVIGDPTSTDDIILIWDYENNHKPKLYLHCQNEVSSMSFCPYNEYILVTGYTNGQISIWDLTTWFTKQKVQKYKSIVEQSNCDQLRKLHNWFIRTIEGNHAFPTITTSPSVGHTSPVTSISWFPPKNNEGIDTNHPYYLKFMTSGLDDKAMLMWVVDPRQILGSELEKHFTRHRTKPAALNEGESILKGLKNFFVPSQKYFLGSFECPQKNPLLKVMQKDFYTYKATDPETLKNLNAQTRFSSTAFESPFTKESNVLFTGGLGNSQIVSFIDDSTGANYQFCSLKQLEAVHDGPIFVCEANMFFRNIVLTVGGSVFAIWDCNKSQVALFWRKCKQRYLSGMWCFHRPLSILLLRSDRYFDYWNVCEDSMCPIQSFKYTGYEPIMFHGDSNKFHVRKNTFITTDKIGSFKVWLLPSETLDQDVSSLHEADDFIRHSLELIERKKFLRIRYKKIQEDWVSIEESLNVSETKVEEMVQRQRVDLFQEQLEGHGISVLLRLRQVDIGKLEENKLKLKLGKCNEKEEIAKRQFKLQKLKENINIKHSSNQIAKGFEKLNPTGKVYKVSLRPHEVEQLKKKFFHDYEMIETDIKINLERNRTLASKEFEAKTIVNFMEKYSCEYRKSYIGRYHRDQYKDLNLTDNTNIPFRSVKEPFPDYIYI